jgi:putative acetyltransferase
MPVTIQPIQPQQIPEARRVILAVARNIFQWPGTLEDILRDFEANGELHDLDDLQAEYLQRQGLFLAAMDGERLVGTGGIRCLEGDTAELKRLWLLEAYHGQGIGYRLVQELLEHARSQGFRCVRLLTDGKQGRAVGFYQRVGFHIVPSFSDDPEDIWMEMRL